MRHPHHCAYTFPPGRHRTGLFLVILLAFLSEVRGLPVKERLQAAMRMYFSEHPDFKEGDYNERKVKGLVEKNLEGRNSEELPGLVARMDAEPLYQQVLVKLQQREPSPDSTTSEEPPWRRRGPRSEGPRSERSRSPVRLVPRSKALIPKSKAKPMALAAAAKAKAAVNAKTMPKAKLLPTTKHMPKAKAKAQSAVHGSVRLELDVPEDNAKSEVLGPRSTGSSSSSSDVPEDDEPEDEDWVHRNCWMCGACGSMNLRFTQWCVCGTQREWQEDWRWKPAEGDWVCEVCGNNNFQWRTWCAWSDCPTGDWECVCGNVNFARRRICNRNTCQKPRPW